MKLVEAYVFEFSAIKVYEMEINLTFNEDTHVTLITIYGNQ